MTENPPMIGVPLAELCSRHHRDLDAVVQQLLADPSALLVEKAVAEKLVAEWDRGDQQRVREANRRHVVPVTAAAVTAFMREHANEWLPGGGDGCLASCEHMWQPAAVPDLFDMLVAHRDGCPNHP